MAGVLDAHGGGYHPVVMDKGSHGDDKHGMYGMWWVFAIVIIFFALLLVWKKDGDRQHYGLNALEGLAPALAMGAMNKQHQPHYADTRGYQEHWDTMIAQLKEFGELKKESALLTLGQSREMDQRFFEQQRSMLVGFKDTEIQGLKSTGEITRRIDDMERRLEERRQDDIIRKQSEEINYLKTVAALQPRAPMPAYFPNFGVPVQHNVWASDPGCHPAHG